MIKLSTLKPNPKNPRLIKDDKFKKLVKSIEQFPEMMEKRPMICVTDNDGKLYPLGGNMRLRAIQELKFKEIPDTWVMLADDWTVEQRLEFTIKDNVGFGEWNWEDLANEWDTEQLSDWGLDIPVWAAGVDENNMTDSDVNLNDEFDPIGKAKDLVKIVFIFDNSIEAKQFYEKYEIPYQYKVMNGGTGGDSKVWQINLSTVYGE